MSTGELIGKRCGNYVLDAVLGTGGMGTVYSAVHPTLGKRVAIKLLKPDLARDRSALGRLVDEARAAAAIGHENITEVFDFGESEGMPYLAMELLVGETLHDLLEREGRLDPRRAVSIAQQICAALGAAHRRGIIHRDLKPQNIFLVRTASNGERVKVLDFGVAKLLDAVSRAGPATTTGAVVGTPHFMAPEQARSEPVDGRADLFALGVVLYRALTGALPFRGGTFAEVLAALLNDPVPPFSAQISGAKIPASLEQVVLRALSKKAADRQPDMETLARELETAVPRPAVDAHAETQLSKSDLPAPGAGKPPEPEPPLLTGQDIDVNSAVSTAEERTYRRVLFIRLALLYPLIIGLVLLGYYLLLRSSVVNRSVAHELPLITAALTPLAYLLEIGFYLAMRRKRSPRLLHFLAIACFVLTITYGVQVNGTLTNYMAMLYAILIAFLRLRLDNRAALFATLLSIGCYLTVVILEQVGLIPYGRLLPGLYSSAVAHSPTFAGVIAMGVVSFLAITHLGAHLLVRGLEAREEALAEVTRGLEGRVAEQVDVLRRRERLRHYLPAPLVDAVVQEGSEVKVGFARQKIAAAVCVLDDYYARVGTLEPEDQTRILNDFYAAATHVAQRFGLTLDGLTGPSLTFLSGAPRSQGEREDAMRAVRAAVALMHRVAELLPAWETLGAHLVPKTGVHFGYAAVGNFGSEVRLQYTAVGPGLALAAAAAVAAPSGVVVTAPTRKLCGDAFEFVPAGDVRAPGGEPVPIFSVK